MILASTARPGVGMVLALREADGMPPARGKGGREGYCRAAFFAYKNKKNSSTPAPTWLRRPPLGCNKTRYIRRILGSFYTKWHYENRAEADLQVQNVQTQVY